MMVFSLIRANLKISMPFYPWAIVFALNVLSAGPARMAIAETWRPMQAEKGISSA